jgi:YVTN family beta-propeller protein
VLVASCGDSEKKTSKIESTIPSAEVTLPPNDNTSSTPQALESYTNFESGQVRALAIDKENRRLFALNTPNNTLEVFAISDDGNLTLTSSVSVGLEPVAVAIHEGQAWVVNHLSDSISIVDIASSPMTVINTIQVGDEPRDIVFAGEKHSKAFITTAHRGQNNPNDPQLTTPGVGRADVWVFDTNIETIPIEYRPTTVITLFADTPRALAVTPDGKTVYAAAYLSGNKTTTLGAEDLIKQAPYTGVDGIEAPDTGLIVQFNGQHWVDEHGNVFDDKVRFELPDLDVFSIDATADIPIATNSYAGVGSHLFNMLVNPQSGALYVSNQEAFNLTRFEGLSRDTSTVRAHIVESRITVIKKKDDVVNITPIHLNKHIDYKIPEGNDSERALSLAMPLGMDISNDGATLYVAAFSSSKIGIFDTKMLEDNSFTPNIDKQISLSGGGPTSVLINEEDDRLYVLTRFDNSISTLDLTTNKEIQHLGMFNPEPLHITQGRPFLYDATNTSGHGDASCGSCHLFGDTDGLAWDLGDPEAQVTVSPNTYVKEDFGDKKPSFHPLKGPMTTQSFRGLTGNGPMHWRGDRTGKNATTSESLESAAFKEFNPAFVGLLGMENELSAEDMQKFTDFALSITYPPNPIRALDNTLNISQSEGKRIYLEDDVVDDQQCNTCHKLSPENGQFGTAGLMSVEGPAIVEDFKVPHLRNLYQKVGMFGHSGRFIPGGPSKNMGQQIKGFGYLHDGSVDTLSHFLTANVFDLESLEKRQHLENFLLAYASEQAPIVGQQLTINADNTSNKSPRLTLLKARALITQPRQECDLIAHGIFGGSPRSTIFQSNGLWQTDNKEESLDTDQLLTLGTANDQSMTFSCVPPGSGLRIAIDHDEDGLFNQDEIDAGTDPLIPNN